MGRDFRRLASDEISRKAISHGIEELQEKGGASTGRIRRKGGGRKQTVSKDASLREDLERLVEPVTRGDPESPLAGRVRVYASWPRN